MISMNTASRRTMCDPLTADPESLEVTSMVERRRVKAGSRTNKVAPEKENSTLFTCM